MYRNKEVIVELPYLRAWDGDARGFVLAPTTPNEISVRPVSCCPMRRFPNCWRSHVPEKELRLCRLPPRWLQIALLFCPEMAPLLSRNGPSVKIFPLTLTKRMHHQPALY